MIEGIVWEKDVKGQWVKTVDNWPEGRKSARIKADSDSPFGQYSKNEALAKIEEWIAKNQLVKNFRIAVVPGKEMSAESKEKLIEFTKKKKIERGELEPVESYISKEE